MSASPDDMAMRKRQGAALHRLFSDLFWRGRQTAGNRKVPSHTVFARKVMPLFLFALVGMVLPLLGHKSPTLVQASLAHAMTFMMVGMTLATSCGTLLFNDQESDILLHRPVSATMILQAKVKVILTQTFFLALALNLAGMIVGVFRQGGSWRYVPAHVLSLFLLSLLAVGSVVLAFHLCLKFFGRERLNSMITTSQVLVGVAIMVGGQVVPRMMRQVDVTQFTDSVWIFALPPVWFGSLDALAVDLAPAFSLWLAAGLAFGVTGLVAWLAFSRLSGSYDRAVLALNEHVASPGQAARGGERWTTRLAGWGPMRWWLRDPVERAAFLLTAAQLTRARDVKLRIYPVIAQFAAYPLIFMMGSRNDTHGIMAGLMSGFLGTIPLTLVGLLRFSEEYRGAELFRFAPIGSPGALFFGARKAAMLFVFAPVVLAWILLFTLVWKAGQTLVILLPGLMVAHVLGLLPGVLSPLVPFSETQAESKGMGNGCLPMVLGFGGALTIGGLTSLAKHQGWLWPWMAGVAVVCVALAAVFRRVIRSRVGFEED